uniref:Nadph-dependent diflavin oxidoreductase 1 n=1 Tax=Limosa lapponica baueri TaxID=1758121 RepID=A0A2I0TCC4_LIMLA|nr:nadph-dependent diflavin oxidoreductase 1 [Limosa lapponica baueri]
MALVWTQAHPDRIQILMAVVRYKTRLSKPRRGLCSTWLASLNPEQGNCLFFGCRQESKDFYCQAEWEELVTKGFLTLFTAFSRDQRAWWGGTVVSSLPNTTLMLARIPNSTAVLLPAGTCLPQVLGQGWPQIRR